MAAVLYPYDERKMFTQILTVKIKMLSFQSAVMEDGHFISGMLPTYHATSNFRSFGTLKICHILLETQRT